MKRLLQRISPNLAQPFTVFLLVIACPGMLMAQALSISADNKKQCEQLCADLVFDCKPPPLYHNGMCTIITYTPDYYSGIAVALSDANQCAALGRHMGTDWEYEWVKKKTADGRGWCVEVPSGAPAGQSGGLAPDLTREWNTPYGNLHLTRNGDTFEGWYGVENKTIKGKLSFESGQWVFQGEWGRKNNPNHKGGFHWTFKDREHFTGTWWYDWSPSQTTAWLGNCIGCASP